MSAPPPATQCPLEHYCPLSTAQKANVLQTGRDRLEHKAAEIIKSQTVLNGPFKGMRYPALRTCGSSIFPKLLGSYEREIADTIETFCKESYSSVVNIGCGEGYYAVGLAMRIPRATVYAFDSSKVAQMCCKEMAQLNKVDVKIGDFCDRNTLMNLDLGPRALIISDCEGYEIKLFDKNLAEHLKIHDFLIESHDCFNVETTQYLHSVFKDTHNINEIESVDDILKAYRYDYPELASFTLGEKLEFLREGRKNIMRWLYMTPQ